MPKKSNPPGPVGDRVAATIAELRADGRVSKTALAARLTDIGRPLSIDVLTKIEDGRRTVDADDLVCLALALETTPLRLMFGPPSEDEIDITPTWSGSSTSARLWAQGQEYLSGDSNQARRIRQLITELSGEVGDRGER